jgi:hypothetical protein
MQFWRMKDNEKKKKKKDFGKSLKMPKFDPVHLKLGPKFGIDRYYVVFDHLFNNS